MSYRNSSSLFKDSTLSETNFLRSFDKHLALGFLLVLISIRLAKLKTFKFKSLHISPPCEKVIQDAERTNRQNGHENAGFLSVQGGFSPLQTIKKLPPSHAVWDRLVEDLPRLIQSQTLRESVTKMSLLDASAKALPDLYLQRAATILGMTAHAFVRLEGRESLTLKYDSHSSILPPPLAIPWAMVCERLERPNTSLTYVDGVVANFTSTSPLHSGVTLENLELLVPTVGTLEERIFIGIMIEINAKTIPVLHQIIEAQRSVLANDSPALKKAIRNLWPLLKQITEILKKLHANRSHKIHMDPVLWTLTVANFGIPWIKDSVGAAGTAHPFFHMMDEFIGRSQYNTGIGKEAQIVRATYPIHWRQFLQSISKVSVTEYVIASEDEELMGLWQAFKSSYHGNDGLLGFHRRKVFGFLAVSFRIGRSTTINGLGRKRKTEPWHEVDQELEKSRLERKTREESDEISDANSSSKKVFMSQIIQHNSPETGYWFSAKGNVYDATAFMQKHPGGDTVIALCSGQDVTDSLMAVGHLTDPSTRKKLENYRVGNLQKPLFVSPHAEQIYMAAVDLGQKAAEIENTHRRNFQLLDGKLTNLDEPGILTPKKARHLLDSKNRLQCEHVPALATLLDALLDIIANLGGSKVETSSVSQQIAAIIRSETETNTTTPFSNYQTALEGLQNSLDELVKTKKLIAMVLEIFEKPGITSLEKNRLDCVVDRLSRIATQLTLLSRK